MRIRDWSSDVGSSDLADDPRDGVVGGKGRVHGHARLYVADGAVLPCAIGLHPSRTIAALAEHLAAALIDRKRVVSGKRFSVTLHLRCRRSLKTIIETLLNEHTI